MNMWTKRALGLLVLCVLVLVGVSGLVYRALWVRYEQGLQQFEARSERIDGVIRAGETIEKRLGVARDVVAPLLFARGTNAENEIQQKLRDLISASGVTLVSSQAALEEAGDKKIARYRLTATVTGEWAKTLRFMETLQTHTPPFWVRSVTLMREGLPTGPQNIRLTVQLEAPLAPAKGRP